MSEIEILSALEQNLAVVTETLKVVREMMERKEQPVIIAQSDLMEELLTVKEAAKVLNISESCLRGLLILDPKKDGLESFKVGGNIRISRGYIADYLERVKKYKLD